MLGAVDSRPIEEFTPRKRETYGDAYQFFQDSPDLRRAILQDPIETAEIESIGPQTKRNTSEVKETSLEMVNLGKDTENDDVATRNRRPLSTATTSQQLVKSPSGRNERIDAAKDKIASKVSISKGSFSSSHQKSTTSTTASRTSKNGLDKVTNSHFSNFSLAPLLLQRARWNPQIKSLLRDYNIKLLKFLLRQIV
jgi:hypothetical protein